LSCSGHLEGDDAVVAARRHRRTIVIPVHWGAYGFLFVHERRVPRNSDRLAARARLDARDAAGRRQLAAARRTTAALAAGSARRPRTGAVNQELEQRPGGFRRRDVVEVHCRCSAPSSIVISYSPGSRPVSARCEASDKMPLCSTRPRNVRASSSLNDAVSSSAPRRSPANPRTAGT
jgi:hypothetical protein